MVEVAFGISEQLSEQEKWKFGARISALGAQKCPVCSKLTTVWSSLTAAGRYRYVHGTRQINFILKIIAFIIDHILHLTNFPTKI